MVKGFLVFIAVSCLRLAESDKTCDLRLPEDALDLGISGDESFFLLQVQHDKSRASDPRITGGHKHVANETRASKQGQLHEESSLLQSDGHLHKTGSTQTVKDNRTLLDLNWTLIAAGGGLALVLVAVWYCCSADFKKSVDEWLVEVTLSDLPPDRRQSYILFGLAMGISLATLQFIGPVRTAVFFDLVGSAQEPTAKSLVLVVLLPIVMLYSIAVTILPSARTLVIVVNGFYTFLFLFIAVALSVGAGPWIAWVLYFAAETKGVILMPMIWSVIADVSTSELSKKAYPFIFFVTQLGGIAGSFIAISVSDLGGEVGLLLIQTGTLAVIAGLTWLGCSVLEDTAVGEQEPVLQESTVEEAKGNTFSDGLKAALQKIWEGSEGLWLLLSRPYVFMAFFVSYAQLMTRTVLDYENAVLVKAAYPERDDQISYWGHMTLIQNTAIALITLLGTRKLLAIFSVGKVMLILPVTSLGCIFFLCVHFELLTSTLACIIASTVAYSLNSPCKEILFVRTSRDIKYKAKSWSEMYGNNLMKILGAQINLFVNNDKDTCTPNCFKPIPTIAMAGSWVALWIGVVLRVGWQFQELDAEDKIID